MEKKYELVPEGGLFRVVALKTFFNAKKGELGGLVSGPENLSQNGNCWIESGAKVLDNARVYEDAVVRGTAEILDYAQVYGNAIVSYSTVVRESAKVYDDAVVYGSAKISGRAEIFGNACVRGKAEVYGDAKVFGNAKAGTKAVICGTSSVYGGATISNSIVYGNANVSGRAEIYDLCVDGAIASISPTIVLNYFPHKVTIFDEETRIGCTVKTNKDWLSMTNEDVKNFRPLYVSYATELRKMIRRHMKKVKEASCE